MAESGVSGAIIPDLPLEEIGPWAEAADGADVATVLLVAPSTPPDRVRAVSERSRGFVYAVGRMGVTGEQTVLADSARQVAERAGAVTRLPVCVGIGVSTPEQAVEVCQVADGVVVGSALVRRLLEGAGTRRRGRVRLLPAPCPRRRLSRPAEVWPEPRWPADRARAQDRSGRMRW